MFGWLAHALAYCYQIWPSYAGSITLLTLAIMIVLLPLTLKGTRGMLEMQRLQPEMKRLQTKYKDDRQRLNEEMMALYKEHGVNPLGSCLPTLIQLPVFWVLYEILEGLTHRAHTGYDVGAALTGNAHAINAAGNFMPSYISHSSKLYEALHGTSKMMSLGIDLSESVLSAFGKGFGHSAPFLAMLALVIATTYFQQWQIQSRTPQNQVNSQQQMMMKFMPLIFAVIYIAIPAGVVVYFLVSNAFRIVQQHFITRTMFPATADAGSGGSSGEPTTRGWRSMLPSSESLPQLGRNQPTKGGTSTKGAKNGSAKGASAKRSSAKRGSAKGGSAKGGSAKGGSAKGGSAKGGSGKGGSGKSPAKAKGGSGKARGGQQGKGGGGNRQRGKPGGQQQPSTTAAPKASSSSNGTGASTPASTGNGASRGRASAPNRKSPPPPSRAAAKKKRK